MDYWCMFDTTTKNGLNLPFPLKMGEQTGSVRPHRWQQQHTAHTAAAKEAGEPGVKNVT